MLYFCAMNEHMTQAFAEGVRAGQLLLAPSLNPYREDDPRHAEWHRGWQRGTVSRVTRRAA